VVEEHVALEEAAEERLLGGGKRVREAARRSHWLAAAGSTLALPWEERAM
jgi:hypothetical protein